MYSPFKGGIKSYTRKGVSIIVETVSGCGSWAFGGGR